MSWYAHNNRYLSAALAWLRLRLQAAATEHQQQQGMRRPFGGGADGPSPQAIEAAAADMQAAAQAAPDPPALEVLRVRFGLTTFEQQVLLLGAAPAYDTRIPALCAAAQDDPARTQPTAALALSLFDDPTWDALSPEGPLRHWRLLDLPGGLSATAPLRVDERIVNHLKGVNALDTRLGNLMVPADAESEADLPPSTAASVQQVAGGFHHGQPLRELPIVQLLGSDSVSKRLVAAHAAAELGLPLYRVPVEMLPAQPADLEQVARLWSRESMLRPVALYIDANEADLTTDALLPRLKRFFERADGVFFLDVLEPVTGFFRPVSLVDVTRPTTAEQHRLWAANIPADDRETAGALAAQFNLSQPVITRLTRTTPPDDLWSACLAHARPRLDLLAQRIDVRASWDDLVLPDAETELLHQMVAQVSGRYTVYEQWGFAQCMNRGTGITALFAGESGTGKTMAAEVIASALRLNLYRIDLSAVVSKYIGETEKNLRRVFDAAEDGGAVLFFDEADALFGKRSEVKDSHDRYANIETTYLLQRMEAYRGLAILATNMKSALDTAFMRRLRFIVDFPFPGVAQRKRIWQRALPPGLPTRDLDFDYLARFNLTGGNIHSVVLNAAFLAAVANTPLTMPLLLTAARTEFRKLDMPVHDAAFHWNKHTNGVIG